MIDKTSTALIVALISILGLTSCIRYNVAEPLDRFSSPEMGTADGNEITVTAGSTWFAEGEYENFILTGQALTGENAEAALLFHHTDGSSMLYRTLTPLSYKRVCRALAQPRFYCTKRYER